MIISFKILSTLLLGLATALLLLSDNNCFTEILILLIGSTICLGFSEILREIRYINKGIIIRDPKTGIFKKK